MQVGEVRITMERPKRVCRRARISCSHCCLADQTICAETFIKHVRSFWRNGTWSQRTVEGRDPSQWELSLMIAEGVGVVPDQHYANVLSDPDLDEGDQSELSDGPEVMEQAGYGPGDEMKDASIVHTSVAVGSLELPADGTSLQALALFTWLLETKVPVNSADRLFKLLSNLSGEDETLTRTKMMTKIGICQDNFDTRAMCPNCNNTYPEDEWMNGHSPLVCTFQEYPNARMLKTRAPCNIPLMTERLVWNRKKGASRAQVKSYAPTMPLYYKSPQAWLAEMLERRNFSDKWEAWRTREQTFDPATGDAIGTDIYDFALWRDHQTVDGVPFLSVPGNGAMQTNVDWFQTWEYTEYGVGVVWGVWLNIPREERYRSVHSSCLVVCFDAALLTQLTTTHIPYQVQDGECDDTNATAWWKGKRNPLSSIDQSVDR
jgi:hypothetical protein